jgi:Leucine-rich repeat (LRR) protein
MSLLLPVGVVSSKGHDDDEDDEGDDKLAAWKINAINERVDQCEKRKLFQQKEELMLDNLKLTADDIPMPLLQDTALGKTLYTLTLCGNPLQTIPDRLVQCLPELRVLDLQQCDLQTLPEHWNLPRLTTLDLSHNLLTGFPDEVCILSATMAGKCNAIHTILTQTLSSVRRMIDGDRMCYGVFPSCGR